MRFHRKFLCLSVLTLVSLAAAQAPTPPQPSPSRADILRGEYSEWRANNDLLSYDLDVRVDPERKFISGKNTIRFKMLRDDKRIQLDLFADLNVDKILHGATELKYTRELGTVFVDFPAPLKKDSVQSIEFHYSGFPKETGRFGGISFRRDPAGRHWITTACQGIGASIWWPNKDQQRDEVENMRLRVAIPSNLTDVSNGRLTGKTDLGDGYTRWDWTISYPINNYSVSLNIGQYEHFNDRLGDLTMDFYCLPENLEKAKRQFAQAKPMIEAFEK
ncbi:MAG TPA: M1 family peptidase, partial [Blastocatellia bacterium]|nr:M1 family peptidase [Blastocatellia bacterium]